MKKILSIFTAFFIFACSSYPSTSTIQRLGGEEDILRKLSDPELRKDKIFVMANMTNIADFVVINVRVNGEVLQIKNSEILVFDLMEGENSILSFGEIFGDEVGSCKPYENYVFNTADFQDKDTHYFVIADRGCYADLHIEKEGFFYIKSNPDSKWRDNPWLINKDWATWSKYSSQ